ncbi:hypothetical protein CMI48_04605 [Candidatus Pacearchaeota archaeon]|nr:hypothetical protein [Candidatus Pacearchaeota archaeon]
MEKSLLVQFLGENPVFAIVDFLIEHKDVDVSKKDIIGGAGISRATFFNHWPELERQGIVKVTRQFGKTKLYMLDTESEIVKKLLELEGVLIARTLQGHSKFSAGSLKERNLAS